jgi:hypothetical protein
VTRLTKSQPVALLGEAPPREFVEPRGSRANSWEDVADLSARVGIVLDGWQELILKAAMGERSDVTWAAKRVGVSVARQNGKSQLLVSRALAGALLFGEKKIVISAHQQDTARETFGKMVEILEADGNAWLMDRVRPNGIMNAINREAIKFKNGATVQFKARTASGGRGFSSDCLMLDEAQRLRRASWVSINSTMSAMPNPQVWLLGTPPTRDDMESGMGEVFQSIRASAVNGVSTAAAWAEWGSDPKAPDYDPATEYTRWKANPAWNSRINHEIVQGEFESYTSEEFAQDRLGVWLEDLGGGGTRALSEEVWDLTGVGSKPDGVRSYSVAFSFKGDRLSVAGSVKHPDGVHVELIDATQGLPRDVEAGLGGLADWLASRWKEAATFVLAGSAGAGVLEKLLVDRGVPRGMIVVANTPTYLQAVAMSLEAFRAATATHLASDGQSVLDQSVAVTDVDKRGGLVATVPDGDETPFEAVSLALWGSRTTKRKPRGVEKREAVIL